jgi:hypothetical protein
MLLEWARPPLFLLALFAVLGILSVSLIPYCLVHGISICNDSIGESLLFEGFE